MAETQIESTDYTWNPVAGCSIVTAGCTHCYAMEMAKHLEAIGPEDRKQRPDQSGHIEIRCWRLLGHDRTVLFAGPRRADFS